MRAVHFAKSHGTSRFGRDNKLTSSADLSLQLSLWQDDEA